VDGWPYCSAATGDRDTGASRALTLTMIRKIAGAWHVPGKVRAQDYALAKA